MNYAIVLAGGKGSRIGIEGVPKQFMSLYGKPIIIYTIENLLKVNNIDKIVAVCNKDYITFLDDLLAEFKLKGKVDVTCGGATRLDSTLNGISYIKETYGVKDDDIFLAHDSVRPFTSERIIEENIKYAKMNKAATTVFNLSETIVETNDTGDIYKLYPRQNLFTGQSPQTFNINYFLECTSKIPKETMDSFNDLSSNITYCNGVVTPVIGDRNNIKITYPIDLEIAKSFLNKE